MKFGNITPMWFRYEPQFPCIKKLKKDERPYCEMKRLTMNEAIARYAPGVQGDAQLWLNREVEKRYTVKDEDGNPVNVVTDEHIEMLDEGDRDFVQSLKLLPDTIIKDFQVFCRHTRNWKNVLIGEQEENDPFNIFFQFYAVFDDKKLDDDGDPVRLADLICQEIYSTVRMSEEELGNFKRRFIGDETRGTSRSRKTKTAKK